jgi:Domain of unknown function (DUF4832)/Beta-galactosidase
MRGLYRWRNQEYAPQPRPAYDSYERYNWRQIEPQLDQYDFSAIDRDIEQAVSEGRKHAFRIRTMVQGQDATAPDYLIEGVRLSWYGDTDGNGSPDTYVPDWNDPFFLERLAKLAAALGERYNGDPRIAWVDVGMYGNWGEWHIWPFLDGYPRENGVEKPSEASKRAIIDAMARAFPDTQLIMGSAETEALVYALQTYPQMGWRRDSLGDMLFTTSAGWRKLGQTPEQWALVTERWKSAPIISEFISPNDQRDPDVYQLALAQAAEYHVSLVSNGNTLAWDNLSEAGREGMLILGKAVGYRYAPQQISVPAILTPGESFTISAEWNNLGNAPAYEQWEIVYQLRSPNGGGIVWEAPSMLDIRTVLPQNPAVAIPPIASLDQTATPVSSPSPIPTVTAQPPILYIQEDSLILAPDLVPGTYELSLIVRDKRGYRAPLALAIAGRSGTGAYPLGQIQVVQQ